MKTEVLFIGLLRYEVIQVHSGSLRVTKIKKHFRPKRILKYNKFANDAVQLDPLLKVPVVSERNIHARTHANCL